MGVTMTASVVSLQLHDIGLMVSVDLEMTGAIFNIPVVFGPFNNREDAEEWGNQLETAHARRYFKDLSEGALQGEIYDKDGYPLRPYLDFHISDPRVIETPKAHRNARYFFPQKTPEETELLIGEYAVRVGNDRLAYSCHLLDIQQK